MSITGKIISTAELNPVVVRPRNDILDLNPMLTAALSVERLPLWEGKPVRPLGWVEGTAMCSSTGQVYDPQLFPADGIKIDADMRFLAQERYWDASAGTWTPFRTTDGTATGRAPIGNLPVISEITKETGDGVVRDLEYLLITDQSRLTMELGYSRPSMTITMVVDPIAFYSVMPFLSTSDVPENKQVVVRYVDKFDYLWSGTGSSVDPIVAIGKMSPVYITLKILPPSATMIVSYAPNRAFKTTQSARAGYDPLKMVFDIGASDAHDTFAFRLYELSYWGDAISDDRIIASHQELMSVYGVNDAWR